MGKGSRLTKEQFCGMESAVWQALFAKKEENKFAQVKLTLPCVNYIMSDK